MPLWAILVLAGVTFAFRVAGPVFEHRFTLPERVQDVLSTGAIVLLVALIATGTIMAGQDFAGWARPAGVLVGAVLALRKAPFPAVVVAAVATTAGLRLLGVD
jgi:branched-subunit amino acid transport protein